MPEQPPLRIDVWSDVVCPFCWIGKRHLEEAVRRLGVEEKVQVVPRAFELDPSAKGSGPLREALARKFGGDEAARQMTAHVEAMGERAGLEFAFDRAVAAPTFDAHRVILFARDRGLANKVEERFMRAHFKEGVDLGARGTLRALAEEAGLDGNEVEGMLESDAFADEVRADEEIAREIGVRGVPFAVVGGAFAVSGAQPVEVFEDALRRALDKADAGEPEG